MPSIDKVSLSVGGIYFRYWFVVENEMSVLSEVIMNNVIYTIPEIKTILNPVFSAYKVSKAVLFGSYVKGSATENSDIDIIVDSSLRGLLFVGFAEEVRKAVDKNVDVFDFAHIDSNSVIANEIRDSGVVIYEN